MPSRDLQACGWLMGMGPNVEGRMAQRYVPDMTVCYDCTRVRAAKSLCSDIYVVCFDAYAVCFDVYAVRFDVYVVCFDVNVACLDVYWVHSDVCLVEEARGRCSFAHGCSESEKVHLSLIRPRGTAFQNNLSRTQTRAQRVPSKHFLTHLSNSSQRLQFKVQTFKAE